jgi:hypothetical protein
MTGTSPVMTGASVAPLASKPPLPSPRRRQVAANAEHSSAEPLRASLTRTLTAPLGAGLGFASRVAVDKRPLWAAFVQQRDLIALCRADPARSPRSDRSGAEERRSRLTATGRRGRAGLGILCACTVTKRGKRNSKSPFTAEFQTPKPL